MKNLKKRIPDLLASKLNKPKKLLWLDDIRDPNDIRLDWLAYSPIGKDVDVTWVKNMGEFKNWIQSNGLPDAICFDDDLGNNEPNGYDCAKWLTGYCLDNEVLLPLWGFQTANPVEKVKINRLLKGFMMSFTSGFD